jgi:hypothetical protein
MRVSHSVRGCWCYSHLVSHRVIGLLVVVGVSILGVSLGGDPDLVRTHRHHRRTTAWRARQGHGSGGTGAAGTAAGDGRETGSGVRRNMGALFSPA